MENMLRETSPETEKERGIKPCFRLRLWEIESGAEKSEKAKEEEEEEEIPGGRCQAREESREGIMEKASSLLIFLFPQKIQKTRKQKKNDLF